MKNSVTITHIANAGIMISYCDTKIFVDAIQIGNEYFSAPKANTQLKLLSAQAPFDNVDFVLYSHYHSDHIDIPSNMVYFQTHMPKHIMLPHDPYHRAVALKDALTQQGIEFIEPKIELETKATYDFPQEDVAITCYRTAHDGGAPYEAVHHYTYLITIGGKNILVGADSPIKDCFLYEDLKGQCIDVALFNLLFINSKKGRALIQSIDPKQLIVYHLPFEGHTNTMFRNIAITDTKKYAQELPPAIVFEEELMQVSL